MNKFAQILTQSSKEIRGQRAAILNSDAKDAADEIVRALAKRKREFESKLLNLEDINRDSDFSLKVVKGDFNPGTWFKDMQLLKVQIANISIELEIAENSYKEWFGELPELPTADKPTVKKSYSKTKKDADK